MKRQLATACSAPSVLWRDRQSWRWLSASRSSVAYLGWAGRENIGDDLMFEVHKRLLISNGDTDVVPSPLHRPGVALVRMAHRRPRTVLLGGGTVLLQDQWLRRLARVRELWPGADLVIYGAGAEDPRFGTQLGVTTAEGLRAWTIALRAAKYIGVRGPRSVAALQELGIEAQVVGDPGLAAGSKVSAPPLFDVAVNLTSVRGLDGTPRYRRMVTDSMRGYLKSGLRVGVFGMDRGDVRATAQMLQQADVDLGQIAGLSRPLEPLQTIVRSRMIISERLHGAIYAAACNVPFIHLAYKPKSLDFLDSIQATCVGLGANGELLALPGADYVEAFAVDYRSTIAPRASALAAFFVENYGQARI